MSKILLLKPPHGRLHAVNHSTSRSALSTLLSSSKPPLSPLLHISPSLPSFSSPPPPLRRSSLSFPRRIFPVRALESSSTARTDNEDKEKSKAGGEDDGAPPSSSSTTAESGTDDGVLVEKAGLDGGLPTGEFEMEEFAWWKSFVVKLRMLFAFPWERVKKGSVLTMKLRGQISDQLKSRFASGLSLPQICENFIKAAYDSRISGIYLQIEPLSCGWGKLDEIRRHILDFKKSGVLEKVGIEPQIQRIGKYKSAGDQLSRKSMSQEVCEMLTSLLDSIYGNWLDTISSTQGKTREEIENFINTGVYQVERLKEEGWITNIMYDDEVMSMLKERLGQKDKKNLLIVDYSKYSKVRKWTLGLEGGKVQIAIIRASGSISRTRSPLSIPSSSIVGEQLIEKIRTVRDTQKYKAVILRIDSPGGDALASDLMWREIKLLAATKPVIVSMADVAASGGYYMAMAAGTIVAEKLTLTGSIGVVTGKFSLNKLYERIGFNKEIISRGRFAELNAAEQRPFRPDEAELFAKSAQNAYRQFRDKAAFSRSMTVDQMEEVAQGRVWSGKDAASRGLVDAIGGFSRAVAIARQRANIPQDTQVKLVEVSKPSPSLPEILSGIGNSLFGLDQTVKGVLQDLTSSNGVQARMDGILFESFENASDDNPIFRLIKDYLSSF
ncbi:serine protease SPPA, chloroplastic isoform X2 [Elaeis guineensis]|uniref:Serine protease SPPA, chloroplastic isoform X2 n=1 Tax=Elaeis guineensis var. tenera TaxID=51953 RepID=A0A6I9QAV7_ELAGV|nr:serine protease SPPA, chloroplastic isoform X2 [Elaeis guineensis]